MRRRSPHWIQHTHLFDDDEYECSVCRAAADRPYLFGPRCGAKMAGIRSDASWVDEAETMDLFGL